MQYQLFHTQYTLPIISELLDSMVEIDREATSNLLGALNRVTNNKDGGVMPMFNEPGR